MLITITSGIPSKYYHGLSLHNIGDQIGTGESKQATGNIIFTKSMITQPVSP